MSFTTNGLDSFHRAGKGGRPHRGISVISSLICADQIVVKTIDEALGVPRAEVNAERVDTVRYVLRTFGCVER